MHWRRGISLDHQLRGQVAKAVQNPMVASRHLPTELEASDSNLSIHLITYPAYLLTNSSKRKPPAAALRAQVPRVTPIASASAFRRGNSWNRWFPGGFSF